MANQIDIIIKAIDRASGDINKVTGSGNKLAAGFKSLTGISLGAAGGIAAAGMAAGKIIDMMKQSVEETVAYATSVDSMSRLLQISTEDTSRLIQASDDLFISQEKLQAGLQAATRQGIDVSIEGLKKLSDQYLALPIDEKSEFVLKTFGRSGAEMGKLMEIGADGIDKATAAISDNLIVTKNSMTDIMNYKRSVDNLNDSWQGFKYQIGTEVIPTLDLLMRVMTTGKDEVEIHAQAVNKLQMQYDRAAGAAALGSQTAKDRMEELKNEINALNDEFYNTETAAGEAGISLYGLSDIVTPLSAYFSELTTEMLFNQAAAGLDAESSMALAESMGLIDGNSRMVLDQLGILRDQLDTGTITMDEYVQKVKDLNDQMALIQSKTVVVRVRTELDDQLGLWGQGAHNAYIGLPGTNRAAGGMASGLVRVGERGEEMVSLPRGSRVYNNTQTRQMQGWQESFDYRRMARMFAEELQRVTL